MIVYKLKCTSNHEFEGWFKNIESFEKQRNSKLVACPVCGSDSVEKVITSTRAIKSRDKSEDVATKVSTKKDVGYAILRKISDKVRKEFENVEDRFPEEARKIHHGEVPPKNIYGYTDEQEEKKLKEEGIEFFKFPILKETND